jgi:hypothetical protein
MARRAASLLASGTPGPKRIRLNVGTPRALLRDGGEADAQGVGESLMESMPPRWGAGVVPSYEAIAEEYAEQYFEELDGKPFDREVLDRFAASVKGRGRVGDLGCGPGHGARYLAGRGVDAFGIDAGCFIPS